MDTQIKNIIFQQYGFMPTSIRQLDGYANKNYRIEHNGVKYIFKTYPFEQSLFDLLKAENEVLLQLNTEVKNRYSAPIHPISVGKISGQKTILRLLSYLKGSFLGDQPLNNEVLRTLGTAVATMNTQLLKITHYTIQARQYNWDIASCHLNEPLIKHIQAPEDRKIVAYFFQQYKENVRPLQDQLRKSIIHSDVNEWNVLLDNNRVSGIIDFGDMVYSPLINEVATTLTYILYREDKGIDLAIPFLRAYHQILPLQEKEITVLYYLIAIKLCISVCNSASALKQNPDNQYITISEKPAWRMLRYWLTINPIHAQNIFRQALAFPPIEPPSIETKIEQRHKFISPILSLSYRRPIYMKRAAFQYMYDADGNTYLDAYNNIPHVGHCHPKVVAAAQQQMAQLNTNTRYIYDQLAAYAERLLAKFPASLNKIYFVNSGSAASDLAIRLANNHTGHKRVMVMEHGYHGHTQNGIDISDYKFSHRAGQGQQNHITKAVIPDTYRGQYQNNDGTAGGKYAADAITQIKQSPSPISAFISEPIVGCGGQIPLAKGYLKVLYPAIRAQGGVCISDEVQTGFGRLGEVFWGFEQQQVIPDIVVLGKPMGNGHPMGAVVTTSAIAGSFAQGVEFFSSFGGNPVSCATGLAVLDVIEKEALQQNAKNVGDYYQQLFRELQRDFECIGDVRGSGLFIGVEIIKNAQTLATDRELASNIKNHLRQHNILISTDGPDDSVIKSKPPLCFSRENAEQVVNQIRTFLSK